MHTVPLRYNNFVPLCNNKNKKWPSWLVCPEILIKKSLVLDRLEYGYLLKGVSHQKVIYSLSSKGCSPVSAGIFSAKSPRMCPFLMALCWGKFGFSFCYAFHFTLQPHYVEVLSHKCIFQTGSLNLCMQFWLVFSEINIMLQTGINTLLSPRSLKEPC